jgi:hypothetical protein
MPENRFRNKLAFPIFPPIFFSMYKNLKYKKQEKITSIAYLH